MKNIAQQLAEINKMAEKHKEIPKFTTLNNYVKRGDKTFTKIAGYLTT